MRFWLKELPAFGGFGDIFFESEHLKRASELRFGDRLEFFGVHDQRRLGVARELARCDEVVAGQRKALGAAEDDWRLLLKVSRSIR